MDEGQKPGTVGMTDVLIIGAGPAGLAAAITLRQQGLSATVVYREEKGLFKAGESLSGTAKISLQKLGLWETFLADPHAPCYGNSSGWASDQLHYYPFLYSLNGHGWHIDRRLFERRMRETADRLGVIFYHFDKADALRQNTDHTWQFNADNAEKNIAANILLDASGRNSWVARQLGIFRIKDDRQIAVVAFLKATGQPVEDKSSLVEAVEYGWWYTAPLPDAHLACVFFTDPDIYKNQHLNTPDGWKNCLFSARYTFDRIKNSRYELLEPPGMMAAESSRMPSPVGKNRITAGDAAISFDPLSAHGITLALVSGIDAALAIAGQLSGDAGAFGQYEQLLATVYDHYAEERLKHYRREKRWPDAAYWARRR